MAKARQFDNRAAPSRSPAVRRLPQPRVTALARFVSSKTRFVGLIGLSQLRVAPVLTLARVTTFGFAMAIS